MLLNHVLQMRLVRGAACAQPCHGYEPIIAFRNTERRRDGDAAVAAILVERARDDGGHRGSYGAGVDDRALLKDLQQAIKATEGQSSEAQMAAINAVLERHGATAADVHRLLHAANRRRRTELQSLQQRIGGIIEHLEIDVATADAVDAFLRGQQGRYQR